MLAPHEGATTATVVPASLVRVSRWSSKVLEAGMLEGRSLASEHAAGLAADAQERHRARQGVGHEQLPALLVEVDVGRREAPAAAQQHLGRATSVAELPDHALFEAGDVDV